MPDFKQLSRSVKGLTVLVTGAASGMGRATALVFAAEGANVAVTDLNAEATQAVADEIAAAGGSAKAWVLDVAEPQDITKVVGDVAGISARSISSSTTLECPYACRSTTKGTTPAGTRRWP